MAEAEGAQNLNNLNSYFPGMNKPVTFTAKAYEIRRRVIEFISVFVMNMKVISPSLSLFFAVLTRPIISVLNIFANGFPVESVIPFSNTPLPSWIVFAFDSSTKAKRYFLRSSLYIGVSNASNDGSRANTKLI